jgi:hypothetical protein
VDGDVMELHLGKALPKCDFLTVFWHEINLFLSRSDVVQDTVERCERAHGAEEYGD